MARKIKRTLFSKNHITVTKTKNVNNLNQCVSYKTISNESGYVPCGKNDTIDVIKESPLGFKYKTTETVRLGNSVSYRKGNETKFIVSIFLRKEEYEIVYPISYGDSRINVETRPWDIVEGDKSMSEHFIFDLKRVIDNLLEIIKENRLSIVNTYTVRRQSMSYQELHDKLYVDLFGNKKGIRFQTDEEKLFAHGFDKTSFKKVK